MTTDEGKPSKANLLETLTEFLASPDGLSRAEIQEALICDGVDLQKLSNRYQGFLASAKKAQRKSILDSAPPGLVVLMGTYLFCMQKFWVQIPASPKNGQITKW